MKKYKKVTFEDDMSNMKTEMNNNLLTQNLKKLITWNNLRNSECG